MSHMLKILTRNDNKLEALILQYIIIIIVINHHITVITLKNLIVKATVF